MRKCCVRQLGRIEYGQALELQQQLVAERKQGFGCDHLLLLEHPHVITLGRNGHLENLLASDEIMERAGIAFFPTDRGGDVTYHGPGQLVGYPILDLREWQRDVGAYVRGVEQAIIDTLADYGITAGRIPKLTGVWVDGRKIAAIGVHLSRWVTSHGFALNVNTDLSYFQYIVPCGLTKPVTSMAQLGIRAGVEEVGQRLAVHFGRIFDCEMLLEEPLLAAHEREN
jgi:lipoyl(octanoyl) transferase